MANRVAPLNEWVLVGSLALTFGFVGLNRAGLGYVLPPIVDAWLARAPRRLARAYLDTR